MSKPKRFTRDELVDRALPTFWRHGFSATGVDELVQITGLARSGLYAAFGDKQGLFLATLRAYANGFVRHALKDLSRPDAGLPQIAAYFSTLIEEADRLGLPGPGCFMANTLTGTAPHDPAVRTIVTDHLARLRRLFTAALKHSVAEDDLALVDTPEAVAGALVIAAQGLWAYSRVCGSKTELAAHADTLIRMAQGSIRHDD